MNKINWKEKLSSRKFWAALIAFVTALLTALNVDKMTITQIVGVISTIIPLVIYILAETKVDVERIKANTTIQLEPSEYKIDEIK